MSSERGSEDGGKVPFEPNRRAFMLPVVQLSEFQVRFSVLVRVGERGEMV